MGCEPGDHTHTHRHADRGTPGMLLDQIDIIISRCIQCCVVTASPLVVYITYTSSSVFLQAHDRHTGSLVVSLVSKSTEFLVWICHIFASFRMIEAESYRRLLPKLFADQTL